MYLLLLLLVIIFLLSIIHHDVSVYDMSVYSIALTFFRFSSSPQKLPKKNILRAQAIVVFFPNSTKYPPPKKIQLKLHSNIQENKVNKNVQEKKCKDRTLLLLLRPQGRGEKEIFLGNDESDESGDTFQVVRRTTTS